MIISNSGLKIGLHRYPVYPGIGIVLTRRTDDLAVGLADIRIGTQVQPYATGIGLWVMSGEWSFMTSGYPIFRPISEACVSEVAILRLYDRQTVGHKYFPCI